jgi:hypothetical protein
MRRPTRWRRKKDVRPFADANTDTALTTVWKKRAVRSVEKLRRGRCGSGVTRPPWRRPSASAPAGAAPRATPRDESVAIPVARSQSSEQFRDGFWAENSSTFFWPSSAAEEDEFPSAFGRLEARTTGKIANSPPEMRGTQLPRATAAPNISLRSSRWQVRAASLRRACVPCCAPCCDQPLARKRTSRQVQLAQCWSSRMGRRRGEAGIAKTAN